MLMITMFLRRNERLGIGVVFYFILFMCRGKRCEMELDSGTRLQETSRMPN
jgi:hypothetical protein